MRHPPNPAKICQNDPIWHHFSFCDYILVSEHSKLTFRGMFQVFGVTGQPCVGMELD